MKKTVDVTLAHDLDELAAFEPDGFPFISLYLNAEADKHGRDNFESFVRKEFKARARAFAPESLELAGFEQGAARIKRYLRDELRPSANGLALFASAGTENFFKAVQLDVPIKRNQMYVCHGPHLYPLARLIDQHPRYIVLVADNNSARLFVFGLGRTLSNQTVSNGRTQGGGWSEMRYQRHVDNYHQLHAREAVETLERAAREEAAEHIVLAGDEAIMPLIREQLPRHLADKVIDVLRLDIHTSEHEVLNATLASLRAHNIQTDAERVRHLLDEYRAGGLAVVGARDTLTALYQGQVDELLLSASAREIVCDEEKLDLAQSNGDLQATSAFHSREPHLVTADMMVTRARLSGSKVTFIEDTALLAGVGGCGALLRYRL